MAGDPFKYFRIEGRELLEQLGKGVLDLEKGASAEQVGRLLRLAHTLKGAARVVKQAEIADQAHGMEGILVPYRDSSTALLKDHIDALLRCLDVAGERLAKLSPQPVASERAEGILQPAAAEPPQPDQNGVPEVDMLLESITETHGRVCLLRNNLASLKQARLVADSLAVHLAVPFSVDGRSREASIVGAKAHMLVNELQSSYAGVEREMSASIDQIDRELRQTRESAERLRLIPAGDFFTVLERTARDTARTLGRRVVFEGWGRGIRLDAHVFKVIQSALLQIIRNAVAHGIESESDRIAAGKSAEGHVTIKVARQGRRIVFTCSDDGRGVDLAAVRQALQRQGVAAIESQSWNSQELLRRLLKGGVSTAHAVTELSGRGIGLDLVRAVAAQLGGETTMQTIAGQGTHVALAVPMSLASLDALLVESWGGTVAIPLDAVRQIQRVRLDDIAHTPAGDSTIHAGQSVPFTFLSHLLASTQPFHRGRGPWSAVVVAGESSMAVVGVERLLGLAQVVLRPLPPLAQADPIVAGAFLDVAGTPQLLLDPEALVSAAGRSCATATEPVAVRPRVLIIDDSLTTRMLERSILESAGYDVDLAISGEDGIEKAHRKSYALFLCDVEMPGMDGFTFIEMTQADAELRSVPAILVTSRSSPEDRQRGKAVGARGYIVKSEFEQSNLLQHIRNLVG